ncbi:MAG TPA: UV DNA damage repair endonuclease UvsE [Chthoniobacterales bacterium]|nr:UV DNA damage repair endonuclease UvsE [Chthoniobacterales bacterium]
MQRRQKSPNESPFRLGFAVKILGAEGFKSNDSRRWQQSPHLRVSLDYLQRIFDYLERQNIRMYRMSSDLAPYVTHPEMPQFHRQIRECSSDLRALGRRARELDLRLSFHPSQFIVLNSPDPELVRKSIADLAAQTEMLDRMELGREAVVVVHAGGAYGNVRQGCADWIRTYRKLPAAIRHRLVVENDDVRYSASDVLEIHEATGVPLVFDHQHFCCHNPERLELRATVERFLRTWPNDVQPKLHFSSPRTEMRELARKNPRTGKKEIVRQPPIWTGHADFCQPFEFVGMMRQLAGLAFDVMIEAKAKDLALVRLRQDLLRYAPEIAARLLSRQSLPIVPS